MLGRQLASLLLVTALVSFVVGERTDAVISGLILAASVRLGFVDEYRAEVFKVIRGVARKSGFSNNWMNDELRIFIGGTKRLKVCTRCIRSNKITKAA